MSVYYLWLVSEGGFLQSHQTTEHGVEAARRFVSRGLQELEERGDGAGVVELRLDERERQELGSALAFNRLASPRFRRRLEQRLAARMGLPAFLGERAVRRLRAGKKGRRS